MAAHATILERVSRYYGGKLRTAGPTAAGVDWKSAQQQALRFDQLLKLCDPSQQFSINDYGCGYGALVKHLQTCGANGEYRGFDICTEMIDEARRLHGDSPGCRFFNDERLLEPADYTIASGIFNVKGDIADDAWTQYMLDTIARMAALSRRGFGFNVLTRFVDYRRADLYYADPCMLIEHCAARYSRRIVLLQDYGLYEFTMLVRL